LMEVDHFGGGGGASTHAVPLPLTFASCGAAATVVTLAFQGIGQKQLEPWCAHIQSALQPVPAAGPSPSLAQPLATPPPQSLPPAWLHLLYLEGLAFKLLAGVFRRSAWNGLLPADRPFSAVHVQASAQTADVSQRGTGGGVCRPLPAFSTRHPPG
jgi:hypothetical protein